MSVFTLLSVGGQGGSPSPLNQLVASLGVSCWWLAVSLKVSTTAIAQCLRKRGKSFPLSSWWLHLCLLLVVGCCLMEFQGSTESEASVERKFVDLKNHRACVVGPLECGFGQLCWAQLIHRAISLAELTDRSCHGSCDHRD